MGYLRYGELLVDFYMFLQNVDHYFYDFISII